MNLCRLAEASLHDHQQNKYISICHSRGSPDVLPSDAALHVQNQIGAMLGVSVENMQITKVEKINWPNACLGLPKAEEARAEVVTPGWLLTFNINGQEYHYHVDETGTVLRQEL